MNKDYKEAFKIAKTGDLFFIDPPYDPIKKDSFISYNKEKFITKQQIELSEEIKNLDKRGVKFILTNHNTKLINNLYGEFNMRITKVNRFINADSSKRVNSGEEIIIWNYEMN